MTLPGLILLGCLAAPPAAAAGDTSERLYHSGVRALDTREYYLAMEYFMDALMIDPGFPGARERLREAGEEVLRVERAHASLERLEIMREINQAPHSLRSPQRLGPRPTAGPAREARAPEGLPPPEDEDAEPAPEPPPARKHHKRRAPKTVALEASEAPPAPAAPVGTVVSQKVYLDLDWLKPSGSSAAPRVGAAAPAPDANALYLKGVKAYSTGNLAGAAEAWEQCLKVEPGHAKALKALARAKREARDGTP